MEETNIVKGDLLYVFGRPAFAVSDPYMGPKRQGRLTSYESRRFVEVLDPYTGKIGECPLRSVKKVSQ
jgi:hypothetical protein